MTLAFYYEDWDNLAISGTQDAVLTLKSALEEFYDYHCTILSKYDKSICFDDYDVVVVITITHDELIYDSMATKILWNHCWDYTGTIESYRDCYECVMALSPKHAEHLGTKHWCYNCIDTLVFNRTLEPKAPSSVIYCGGPAWWKGGKKIDNIITDLSRHDFETEYVWEISHEQLADKFNSTEFVIIPSEIESFSLVSVQAQACGCVPIAHDVGGISETIPEQLKPFCLYSEDIPYEWMHNVPYEAKQICVDNAKKFSEEKVAARFHEIMCSL